MGLLGRLRALPGWVDARLAPLRRTSPWRAYARYNAARGNVLAGGVAYFAFFSLFPAMALGFTAFGLLLGGREDLQVHVVQYVNSSLGSRVITYRASGGGVVSVEQLTAPGVLTTAGALGVVTLVMSGLGWISALRDGVQAVFGSRTETNFVVLKLVDLLVLAAAGAAVLVSVVLSVVVNIATDQVLAALGIPGGTVTGWIVNIAGQSVLTLVDAVIFTLMFQRLSSLALPLRDFAAGGLFASVGFTVLKLFGSVLLRAASHNRFLAAFGVVVGLLVWMDLVARLTLVAAAWVATVAGDRGHLTATESSGAPQAPVPPAGSDDGARRIARTLLATGFVAGAAAGWSAVSARRHRSARPD